MEEPVLTFREPKRIKPASQITAADFPCGYSAYDVMSYNDLLCTFVYVEPTRKRDIDVIRRLFAAGIDFTPMPPKGDCPIVEFEQKEYCDPEDIQLFIENYVRERRTREAYVISENRKSDIRSMEWLSGWADRMKTLARELK